MNFLQLYLFLLGINHVNSLNIDQKYCIVKNCHNCARAFQKDFGSKSQRYVCGVMLRQKGCCDFYTRKSRGILFWKFPASVDNKFHLCKFMHVTFCWNYHWMDFWDEYDFTDLDEYDFMIRIPYLFIYFFKSKIYHYYRKQYHSEFHIVDWTHCTACKEPCKKRCVFNFKANIKRLTSSTFDNMVFFRFLSDWWKLLR